MRREAGRTDAIERPLTRPSTPRSQDGRPIYVEQLGKLDLAKLYEVTTPERQLQSLVVEYEKFQRDRLPICSAITGHLIETSCTIMDLKGVGVTQFWKVKNFVQDAAASERRWPLCGPPGSMRPRHTTADVCWPLSLAKQLP